MSKDHRTIHSTIRFGGKSYGPGAEAEFEKAASKDQITRLTEKGAISGFGKSHTESHPETEETATDAAAKTTKTTAKDKG